MGNVFANYQMFHKKHMTDEIVRVKSDTNATYEIKIGPEGQLNIQNVAQSIFDNWNFLSSSGTRTILDKEVKKDFYDVNSIVLPDHFQIDDNTKLKIVEKQKKKLQESFQELSYQIDQHLEFIMGIELFPEFYKESMINDILVRQTEIKRISSSIDWETNSPFEIFKQFKELKKDCSGLLSDHDNEIKNEFNKQIEDLNNIYSDFTKEIELLPDFIKEKSWYKSIHSKIDKEKSKIKEISQSSIREFKNSYAEIQILYKSINQLLNDYRPIIQHSQEYITLNKALETHIKELAQKDQVEAAVVLKDELTLIATKIETHASSLNSLEKVLIESIGKLTILLTPSKEIPKTTQERDLKINDEEFELLKNQLKEGIKILPFKIQSLINSITLKVEKAEKDLINEIKLLEKENPDAETIWKKIEQIVHNNLNTLKEKATVTEGFFGRKITKPLQKLNESQLQNHKNSITATIKSQEKFIKDHAKEINHIQEQEKLFENQKKRIQVKIAEFRADGSEESIIHAFHLEARLQKVIKARENLLNKFETHSENKFEKDLIHYSNNLEDAFEKLLKIYKKSNKLENKDRANITERAQDFIQNEIEKDSSKSQSKLVSNIITGTVEKIIGSLPEDFSEERETMQNFIEKRNLSFNEINSLIAKINKKINDSKTISEDAKIKWYSAYNDLQVRLKAVDELIKSNEAALKETIIDIKKEVKNLQSQINSKNSEFYNSNLTKMISNYELHVKQLATSWNKDLKVNKIDTFDQDWSLKLKENKAKYNKLIDDHQALKQIETYSISLERYEELLQKLPSEIEDGKLVSWMDTEWITRLIDAKKEQLNKIKEEFGPYLIQTKGRDKWKQNLDRIANSGIKELEEKTHLREVAITSREMMTKFNEIKAKINEMKKGGYLLIAEDLEKYCIKEANNLGYRAGKVKNIHGMLTFNTVMTETLARIESKFDESIENYAKQVIIRQQYDRQFEENAKKVVEVINKIEVLNNGMDKVHTLLNDKFISNISLLADDFSLKQLQMLIEQGKKGPMDYKLINKQSYEVRKVTKDRLSKIDETNIEILSKCKDDYEKAEKELKKIFDDLLDKKNYQFVKLLMLSKDLMDPLKGKGKLKNGKQVLELAHEYKKQTDKINYILENHSRLADISYLEQLKYMQKNGLDKQYKNEFKILSDLFKEKIKSRINKNSEKFDEKMQKIQEKLKETKSNKKLQILIDNYNQTKKKYDNLSKNYEERTFFGGTRQMDLDHLPFDKFESYRNTAKQLAQSLNQTLKQIELTLI